MFYRRDLFHKYNDNLSWSNINCYKTLFYEELNSQQNETFIVLMRFCNIMLNNPQISVVEPTKVYFLLMLYIGWGQLLLCHFFIPGPRLKEQFQSGMWQSPGRGEMPQSHRDLALKLLLGQAHVTFASVSLAKANHVTEPTWTGQWEHSSRGEGGRGLCEPQSREYVFSFDRGGK